MSKFSGRKNAAVAANDTSALETESQQCLLSLSPSVSLGVAFAFALEDESKRDIAAEKGKESAQYFQLPWDFSSVSVCPRKIAVYNLLYPELELLTYWATGGFIRMSFSVYEEGDPRRKYVR